MSSTVLHLSKEKTKECQRSNSSGRRMRPQKRPSSVQKRARGVGGRWPCGGLKVKSGFTTQGAQGDIGVSTATLCRCEQICTTVYGTDRSETVDAATQASRCV